MSKTPETAIELIMKYGYNIAIGGQWDITPQPLFHVEQMVLEYGARHHATEEIVRVETPVRYRDGDEPNPGAVRRVVMLLAEALQEWERKQKGAKSPISMP